MSRVSQGEPISSNFNRSNDPEAVAYKLRDQAQMARAAHYFAWQKRLVISALGQRVVEVGCGVGNFTGHLLDREFLAALDSEAACVQRLRERYRGHSNLETLVCDASDPAFLTLAQFRPDSCICLNVLEHIDDDARVLQAMKSILVPRGVIVLIVPAFPALYGPIDRRLGHCRRYRRKSLKALAELSGLTVETMHYVNCIGFFGWWANAHLLRREAQSDTQIAIFDRYFVPWLSRVERLLPPPFGQSLFAVLRKA